MKRRVLSVMLVVLLVLSCAPTALAADDTTPPVMTGVSINQTEFNVGDTLIVTVMCSDMESGLNLDRCYVLLDVLEGLSRLYQAADIRKIDGGIEARYTFDNTFLGGVFSVSYITLYDNNGNAQFYNRGDGILESQTFTVHSDYVPPQKPEFTSFTVSKKKLKPGETVTFTISGSHPTGIVDAGMKIEDPGAFVHKKYDVTLSAVAGKANTFAGSFKIPADMPGSIYYPSDIYITAGSGVKNEVSLCSGLPIKLGDVRFEVINPSIPVNRPWPVLQSFTMSSHRLIPGQKLTVTAKIDPKTYNDIHALITGIYRTQPDEAVASGVVYLYSIGNNTFSGIFEVPANFRAGEYKLSKFSAHTENGVSYGIDNLPALTYQDQYGNNQLKDASLTIVPLLTVSGTYNKSILVGSTFDPMQGVTANNAYTGDITDSIQMVGGSIDTNIPGMYLIKYVVNGTANGISTPVTYTDYRWIGVTEIMPEAPASNAEVPIAVTNDSLAVGAASADVSIKKNGSSIAYSNVVSDPGEYTISSSGSTTASVSGGAVMEAAEVMSAGASGTSVTAVIDRVGPAVTAAWGMSGKAYNVSVKASDVSGVALLKYKAGSCSLADCRDNGTAFSGSFQTSKTGAYTIYAKDKLGNESVKNVMVSSSSADFAYLSSIGVSGGTLSRSFSKTVYSYKIALGENQPSVTLTPVKEWDGAKMTINGKSVQSSTIAVANGKTVKATVKVTYGKTSKTYTFSITRAKSGNTNLLKLTASAGSFNTAFSAGVTNYTLTLDEKTASTTIKAAVENSSSKASPSSTKVKLKNGQSKTIKITVKAQSGAKKTYTVTVTRAKSTNTALKSLKTDSSKYPLSPAFKAGTASYTVTLPANKNKVTISAKTADSLTGVTVDGKKGSKKFTLANGQSITVKVVVTAQSGAKQEYTVTINRL